MLTRNKTLIAIFSIVLIAGALGGYVWFQARDLIGGPQVTLETPSDWTTVGHNFISLSGTARDISYLRLNGKQIYVDENHRFDESLLLPFGYTIMTIEAEDRFGRIVSKKIHLYRPSTSSLL